MEARRLIVTAPTLDLRRLPRRIDGPTRKVKVPARLKRTGMETKLLIQWNTGPVQRTPDRSLIRLIGQARRYRRVLEAAHHDKTMSKIAADVGVGATYFTRVVRLSFLAPEITKMILQGRQPPQLTANRIMTLGSPPTLWDAQKHLLDRT